MASEYNVIGEHKTDEHHLLVIGDDGRYYDYSLTSERVQPVEIDHNWKVDEAFLSDDDPGINSLSANLT
jgi:hypothetical protein